MANIVVLHGSARRQGNTAQLVQAFVRGAEAAGHQVTVLSVATLRIHPCIGCERCATEPDHACFQKDDMTQVYAALVQADTLIIASPVYFYSISAQLKALIDRLHTPLRNTFVIKRVALLLVSGNTLPDMFDAILLQYRMILRYFNIEDLGHILVSGVREPGAITGHPSLEEAYQLGKQM
ncbi:MAG: flavodoxin family protein [Peptococcaceae bacterium]|nr:flavodoxin family protein [Peptococcaceae bacterium]